jgi:hypothetical protein
MAISSGYASIVRLVAAFAKHFEQDRARALRRRASSTTMLPFCCSGAAGEGC